jgi:hypothetical protein
MSKLTSFETDIRPLFTQLDIQSMSKAFNLASYDDVKTHSAAIFDRIRGIGGDRYAATTSERRRFLGTSSHRALRQMDSGRLSALGPGHFGRAPRLTTVPPFRGFIARRRCPLWVISGHVRCNQGCPLYTQ